MRDTEIVRPPEPRELLDAIRRHGDELDRLAAHLTALEEDAVHQYYRRSSKVFALRHAVGASRDLLASLAPDAAQLHPRFMAICRKAYAQCRRAQLGGAEDWDAQARPVLEALWHCSYFVRMLARLGRELEAPPARPPAGWAAALELYGLNLSG